MSRLERFTLWMFRHRTPLVAVFTALTMIMGWYAAHVRVDASFHKSLPLDHPYIRTYLKHERQFGGANRVIVALRAEAGDIFNARFFAELKKVTDEVSSLPSVDRAQVYSIRTPNVRYLEVIDDGLSAGNVIPADFPANPTEANFATVRENIIKSGRLGQLVANDFTAAIVIGQLLEADPRTGEKIDYGRVASALEAIRQRVESASQGTIKVHIVGFAKFIGDVSDGARGVLTLFAISIGITALLVWIYAGRWKLAAAPILCSLVAVVWQLGALTILGYGIDPFSILVPFLVFAIGVSHGVQKICTFRNEVFKGKDGPTAARAAFMQLIAPGIVALLTDTVGFVTMLVIKIPTIQELAITASLGVSVIVITNFFLLPIFLSYLRFPPSYGQWVAGRRARTDQLWRQLAHGLKPLPSMIIILVSLGLGFWGEITAGKILIGDTQAGRPELRPDSPYNRDTATIAEKFSISTDVLSVIVETIPNASVDYDVVTLLDDFEGEIRNVPGVQSVMSLTTLARTYNTYFNEGSLKWRILPRNPQALAAVTSPIETASGYLNSDASVLPIMVFLADHKAETLRAVTTAIENFAATHPSAKATLRLASGPAGVMAATNEVVRAAEKPILYWIFGAVIILCLITFRSLRATLCIVVPLAIVNYLAYAFMVFLGIGLKTSTLPMIALGVGIGVDYGIYIFARLQTALKAGAFFEDAMFAALKDAGAAVVFTGLTLAIGVSTWVFSDLKFQADMGWLLTFMFLVNMIGAIFLLPAMARWLWRRHSINTAAATC